MKKVLLLSFLVCLAAISCSRAFVFHVFNNSGVELVLISYDTRLMPHEFVIPVGSSVDVQHPFKLSIKHSTGVWEYTWVRTVMRYVYSRPFGPRVQDIQIEPDGAIYQLPAKTKQAVKEFPPQPDGVPLKPR